MESSIYELAVTAQPSPQTLSVSPPTLLSLIGSLVDLLIEQRISATLCTKLPPGEVWRSEIERYHRQIGVPHSIYSFSQANNSKSRQGKTSPPVEKLAADRANAEPGFLLSVELAPTSIRRDYFLLVLSPKFHCLILAHRPSSSNTIKAKPTGELNQTQRRLLAICSFEKQVIERVLDGIKQTLTLTSPISTELQAKVAHLLANWDLFQCASTLEPLLLSQLLTKQIHWQEEIWRSTTTNRAATLQLQNQELLNNLQLKEEFFSNLCQEMRTPLTNMKTALTLLASPQLKPNQRQRYLQLLRTECDRQNSLISGFLDLMQLDTLVENSTLQPVRLSDVVPGVVSTYQPLAQEKGIMLAYTVPEELPPVSCLNSWLKQIAINLLHNGIKFTPPGGQVWVRSRQQGDYIQLEFRDTGIGIASNDIPKIFDRFYRVRPGLGKEAGGAGLGLTIVQQLLLRCGGSISVKSKLGEGTVFNVLLPIASSTNQASH